MENSPLKILMVASEAAPFAKTGGLGDVVGSLPAALHELGHQVVLVIPWYRSVRQVTGRLPLSQRRLTVPMGGQILEVRLRHTERDGVAVWFLDHPELFDRPELYGERGTDYPDNAERFGLLSRGALELARRLDFAPDVIHCHDWQTGLIPVYLQHQLWRDRLFAGCGTLFTIHNLGYHGSFSPSALADLGLDPSLADIDGLEFHGQISFLKGGIRFADRVSTVSPTYCREIQTPEAGMGLDGLLRSRSGDLHGILNGIDLQAWNPADDPALSEPFSADRPSGKAACKQALLRELGLPEETQRPLLAMITRLDPQKGIELILEAFDRLLEREVMLVVLGTGRPDYEQRLAEAGSFYPDRCQVLLRFDDALSRRIYAASDLFLMPSRYEPCGLGQQIALRYGCVPLVHATGGLLDTIRDPEQDPEEANGFLFRSFRPQALLAGLDRALEVYGHAEAWQRLRERGMRQDLSWQRAARRYVELYRQCRKARHDRSD